MPQSYKLQLLERPEGPPPQLYCVRCGLLLAKGYKRVVIGGRGPYIEIEPQHMELRNTIHVADWRLSSPQAYYVELRSRCACNVKIYHQRRTVSYADYVPGLYYISPFDLGDSARSPYADWPG